VTDLTGLGRGLLFAGGGLVLLGAVFLLADRLPFLSWLGRLPGDLVFRRDNVTIFVPIVTSIVLSLILSIVISLIFRRQ